MKNLIVRRIILIPALAFIIANCSSKSTMEGTYSQAGKGMEIVLDLMSGTKPSSAGRARNLPVPTK